MRLHRLEITAFGPFADTQCVDFDDLTSSGLFLLHGVTGAGKSSVLDAICFALFGRVPGARGHGARLRSDHAPPGRAPEVICEFSVGGRRLEVTRAPEWQRPKKRGAGSTREPARALLRERTPEGWAALSHRVDEVADTLDQVIGLGAEQFTKLVLLPQGEFAAFLQATPEERRPLLQRLFDTQRFDRVERWLAERRRELSGELAEAQMRTSTLLARAEEAFALLPADSDPAGSTVPDLSVEERLGAWLGRAREVVDSRAPQVRAAAERAEFARREYERGRLTRERQLRHAELAGGLAELRAGAADHERRREALAAAGRAGSIATLFQDVEVAREEASAAEARFAAATGELSAVGQDAAAVTPDHGGRLRERLGVLTDLLPAEHRLAELTRDRDTARGSQEHLEVLAVSRAEKVTELADRLDAARSALADLAAGAARHPDLQAAQDRAAALFEAARRRDRLVEELIERQDARREAVDVHQQAVEETLRLRAARLAGMSAELAGELRDGEACPVCGSAEHPAPAGATGRIVTEGDERAAQSAERAAAESREDAEVRTASTKQQLAAAEAVAEGVGVQAAGQRLAAARKAADAAHDAGLRAAELTEVIRAQDEELVTLRHQQAEALERLGVLRDVLGGIEAERSALELRLADGRGSGSSVSAVHRELAARIAAVETWLEVDRRRRESAHRLADLTAATTAAATRAGFRDPGQARAAVLTAAQQQQLAEQISSHDQAVAAAGGALADPALQAAAEQPVPDLALLSAAATESLAAAEGQRQQQALAEQAVRALTRLHAELGRHHRSVAPLLARAELLEQVSKCADGTGGGNALRMRLSSYVLAARLEEVAAAANARLAQMSDGRYTLRHTDGPARGGARSGLGLAIVDGWTGAERDTTTLSGGETFYASLALALGLADVVHAEAGGSVIETLLVDEGFGALDSETLDEVLDVLDGLRSGGRSVGLISHVTDLRDRIPAQLEVIKTRTGSQTRLAVPV